VAVLVITDYYHHYKGDSFAFPSVERVRSAGKSKYIEFFSCSNRRMSSY
jgi:hypothetical protein